MSTVEILSPNLNGHFQNKSEEKKSVEEFRNYVDSNLQDPVANFYHENHICQTFNFVQEKKKQYSSLNHYKMSIWDAAKYLNEVVDYSDPDTELPQIIHLLQTAEAIRKAWPGEEYDWFHLVGFIHDLGKVLAHPSLFGEHQKAVVGDTFPVGCGFSPKVIFNKYFQENQTSIILSTPPSLESTKKELDLIICTSPGDMMNICTKCVFKTDVLFQKQHCM